MKYSKAPYPKSLVYIVIIAVIALAIAILSLLVLDPVQYAGWLRILTWVVIVVSPLLIVIGFYVQAGEALKESLWKAALGLFVAALSAIFACGDIFSLLNNELDDTNGSLEQWEIVLTDYEMFIRTTSTYSAATAVERIAQTQQVYLANSTDAPTTNLQATLAAVETEVAIGIVAEVAQTAAAYRNRYLTPAATQHAILTQITLTPTPP
jgi:hypothetical protein